MTNTESEFDLPPQVAIAVEAASEKLGSDIVIIDVGDVIGITDQFVLISGSNSRQLKAIADEIEYKIKQGGGPPPERIEGLDELEWVLLDYVDFVVHIFHEDARNYYQLERLWADRPHRSWESQPLGAG